MAFDRAQRCTSSGQHNDLELFKLLFGEAKIMQCVKMLTPTLQCPNVGIAEAGNKCMSCFVHEFPSIRDDIAAAPDEKERLKRFLDFIKKALPVLGAGIIYGAEFIEPIKKILDVILGSLKLSEKELLVEMEHSTSNFQLMELGHALAHSIAERLES